MRIGEVVQYAAQPFPSGKRRGPRIGAGSILLVWSLVVCFGVKSGRLSEAATVATPVAIAPGVCSPPIAATPSSPPERPPTVGVPADAVVANQLTGAIANLVACWNDGDWTTSIALATDHYLQTSAGTSDRAAVTAAHAAQTRAGLGPQATLDAITDARNHGDAFASADVVSHQGKAAKHQRWHFLSAEGAWLLDDIQELGSDVGGDAVGIEATIDAVGLSLSRHQIVSPGIVVIHIRNLANDTNTVSLFRTAGPDVLRTRLLSGRAEGTSAFVGEIVLPPLTDGDLVLVNLAADDYTLVVDFRRPDGTLHVDDALATSLVISTI